VRSELRDSDGGRKGCEEGKSPGNCLLLSRGAAVASRDESGDQKPSRYYCSAIPIVDLL
jgi:hypothetical protein